MAGEHRDGRVPEVHEVASRGFAAQAVAYDRARPSYPPDAVGWLAANLRIGPGQRIVDLAAGTGKLTALLAGTGARLAAVEPVAAMRERLRAGLPAVPLLAGVAEALPFADGSVDAVVVAQAFHWFDADRALAELARVVRVGGRLGLIWNMRDRSIGWVDQIWSVMDRVEGSAPWRGDRGADGSRRPAHRYRTGGSNSAWSGWVRAEFAHVHACTHAEVIDRMRSVSHIAVLPAGRPRAVLDEIRAILRERQETARSPVVEIPYLVDAMYAERLR